MTISTIEEYFDARDLSSWIHISNLYEETLKSSGQWIFRGQRNATWGLRSSLERQIDTFRIAQAETLDLEQGLLRRFQRQCHHYFGDAPKRKDYLEWFALMQHYGAPTRLLDWTYSFFAALFFALDNLVDDDRNKDSYSCAVWALNTEWIKQPFESVLSSYPDVLSEWKNDEGILRPITYRNIFLHQNQISLVGVVTPQRMNQRLVIQQGTFLCPGDVSKSFEDNLIALMSKDKDRAKANFIKLTITIDSSTWKEFLLRLHHMNMNSASLYPGLEGFARSLKNRMADPKHLLHPGIEKYNPY